MRAANALALTLASAGLLADASAFTYQIDDGTTEAFLGVAPRVTVINQFIVEQGSSLINEINVKFTNDAGVPAKVVLWTDPNEDGLPHDAVPRRVVELLTPEQMGQHARSYYFDPLELPVGSVFYVGIYVSSTLTGNRLHGWAPIDLSFNWQRSWVAYGTDVSDLSSVERLDQRYPRLQGSFEIRANSVPEPSTLLLVLGLVGFAKRRRPSGRL